MITDFIINLFFAPWDWVLDAFTGQIDFTSVQFTSIWTQLSAMNYWLPITELSVFVFAIFATGPLNMFLTVAIWLGVGVYRGGSPKA